jgi:hypothetical protein
MTPNSIAALERNVRDVRFERETEDWPDDVLTVPDGDKTFSPEIEDALFGDSVRDEERWPEDAELSINIEEIEKEIERSDLPELILPDGLTTVSGQLERIIGGDFPGSPSGAPSIGVTNASAPTDVYAFYLPWHFFATHLWGIYLIVEGIESLGAQIQRASGGWLTRSQANRVSRMFLFHHEAYHNIAETFASRLEVSHRKPCYVNDFRKIWHKGFSVGLHEEGLADAYAWRNVRSQCFADILPRGIRRNGKRRIAAASLRRIMATSQPPYNSSLQIVTGKISWADAQLEFQEANYQACRLGPKSSTDIWLASGHSMHPSLSRNRNFSYVISRQHPAIRNAANVPHFARKDFVRSLLIAVDGQEEGGGKHPMVKASNGKRVPVPGHRELDRSTCRAILKELGLTARLEEFMGMKDKELKALRREMQGA